MRKRNVAIWVILFGMLFSLVLLWVSVTVAGSSRQEPEGDDAATQATLDDGFWYQGRLTDGDGQPLANAAVNVHVRLYNEPVGGATLAMETITINTDDGGLFNEEIDFGKPELFNGQALYLGLWVDGDGSEMSPRQYLRPVPYALSIRPGAIISTSSSSLAYDPVLEIRSNASGGGDLDGLLVFSESGGEAIEGRSKYGMGVYGSTERSGQTEVAGVYGYAHNDAPAVRGQSRGTDVINSYGGYFNSMYRRGLYAASGGTHYAAYFDGNGPSGNGIYVYGDIAASGDKTAIVQAGEYGTRKLYAMESPSVWFEDFGQSRLDKGQSKVTIDPMFLSTISTEEPYHVFITPLGDCNGLYVTNKTTTSFEIRELGDGTADVAFDYRIVAIRKGYEGVRMELATEGGKPFSIEPRRLSEEPQLEGP